MPGILIEINSRKNKNLGKLTHNRSCFARNEIIFDDLYLGLVDFKNKIKGRTLYLPKEKIAIVIYGDLYLDRKNDKNIKINDKSLIFIILDLYKKFGIQFVQKISGSFSLAIHNGKLKKTFVITDQIGSKPVYYRKIENEIVLSSEIKGLINKESLEYRIEAVYEFLSFSYMLSNKTLFKNIELLPFSSVFIYDHLKKEINIKRYGSYNTSDNPGKDYKLDYLLKIFDDLFINSVWQRIKNYESIGLFLSDGIDSRILAGYCKELCDSTKKHLVFYTFGTPGGREDKISRKISALLDVEYKFFKIPDDQISSYANEIAFKGDGHLRIRDAHFIGGFDKLGLTNDFYLAAYMADTVFGKRISNKLRNVKNRYELNNYILKNHLRMSLSKGINKLYDGDKSFELMKFAKKEFHKIVYNFPNMPFYKMYYYWKLEQRGRRYMVPVLDYGNWYLPISDPFIDKDIINFAIDLPFELLINKNFLRRVLTNKFAKLSKIRLPGGYLVSSPVYPDILIKRIYNKLSYKLKGSMQRLSHGKILFKSKGYRAYDYWIRTGSKEYIKNILLNVETQNHFGFSQGQIEKILKDHLACKSDYDQILCDVLNLTLLDSYINK